MKPTSTTSGVPATRPRNWWDLSDEDVAEAIKEWLERKGAKIGDDATVHYPDRSRMYCGDDKLRFSAHLN